MDPVWVVSIGTLVVAIGTGLFAVLQGQRLRRRNGVPPEMSGDLRVQNLEARVRRLDADNDQLHQDLASCERERVRLMEMLFAKGEGEAH